MAAATGIMQGASAGASLGGTLGSVVPGVGTAIGAGAGALIGAGIAAYPYLTENEAEKENRKRLEKLRMMELGGTLGLSEREQQALYTKQADASALAMKQQQQIGRQYAAAGAGGAGQALLGQTAANEAVARQQAQAARSVEEANLARKRELEQEIQARTAAAAAGEEERQAALASLALAPMAPTAEVIMQQRTVEGQKPSAAEIAAVQKMYNLSTPEEAQGWLEFMARNPNAASYSTLLPGGAAQPAAAAPAAPAAPTGG